MNNDGAFSFFRGQCSDSAVQENRVWQLIPLVFLVYAVPLLLITFINYPLFVGVDEPNHFLRAEQISHGGLFGFRIDNTQSGGYVDPAALTISEQHMDVDSPLDWRNHLKFPCLTADLAKDNRELAWSNQLVFASFNNTSNYLPIVYLPDVAGLLLGKALGLSVIETAHLARLVNGLSSLAICTLALIVCQRGRFLLFTILLFPMSVSLFSSLNQDAILLSIGALFVSMLSNILLRKEPKHTAWWETAVLACSVILLGIARPPYAAIVLCLLLPGVLPVSNDPKRDLINRLVLVSGVSLVILVWMKWLFSTTFSSQIPPFDKVSIKGQLEYLAANPIEVFKVPVRTFIESGKEYIKGVVGLLGWGNTFLPNAYYYVAIIALCVSWFAEGGRKHSLTAYQQIIVALSFIFAVSGIYAVAYLSFSNVGSRSIWGVQGKYFLILLPLLGLLGSYNRRTPVLSGIASWFVITFPVFTLFVMPYVIINRFYIYCVTF